MTQQRGMGLRLWVLVAALCAGCSTAPSRFYRLASTARPDGTAPAHEPIIVGPVTVPGGVDRPQIVVQVAPNRVQLDDFNRWEAPLGESIARVVAGNLAVLLDNPDIATAPLANFKAAYRVTIDVQSFDSMQGDAAFVDAVWAVHNIASGKTRSGRTQAREAVSGPGFEALAAAHSQALAQVSADIAAALRAAQAER